MEDQDLWNRLLVSSCLGWLDIPDNGHLWNTTSCAALVFCRDDDWVMRAGTRHFHMHGTRCRIGPDRGRTNVGSDMPSRSVDSARSITGGSLLCHQLFNPDRARKS